MSSSEGNSDWESGNDSKLLASLRRVENLEKNNPFVEVDEIETDIDELNSTPVKQPLTISQRGWESMKDSQFIEYVNTITSYHQESKLSSSLNESELFGAQKQTDCVESASVYSNPEEINDKDKQKASEFAFEDHETYFATKKGKQELQDQELAKYMRNSDSTNAQTSSIFTNCSIHVNGRTDPDIMTLRKLIVQYGGKFVHHLSSKGQATHIVAEHLPPKKRQEFTYCKVVKPKWITDSIEKNRLQNWALYRIGGLNPFGQRQITETKLAGKLNEELNISNNDELLQKKDNERTEIVAEDEKNVESEFKKEKDDEVSSQSSVFGDNGNGKAIDANHPDFLETFFSKSRLHHLSTWKLSLKSNFLNKAIKVLTERGVHEQCNERVILHVDFDCFFATVSAMYNNPPLDIKSIPICVTHGGGSADVSSCNYKAREFGLRNGMWLSSARKLCPKLVCLPYKFEEYQTKSNLFYDYLLGLDIDSILPISVDEALVDISYLSQKYGILETMTKIKKELDEETGCTLSCGTGSNVLLAKLALRKAKPDNVYHISDSSVLNEINDIAFDKLPGIGHKMYTKLSAYIEKHPVLLSDVREIPLVELNKLFGIKTGLMIHKYSMGEDDTSIDILKDPEEYTRKSIGMDINWGIRFDNDIQTEAFLTRLAGELNKRLRDADMLGTTLTLKVSIRHPDAPINPPKYLGMGRCTFNSKISRLGVATRELSVLASEMRYIWRSMNVEPKELRGVSVSMAGLVQTDQAHEIDANQMKLQFRPFKQKQNVDENPIISTDGLLKKSDEAPVKQPKIERQEFNFQNHFFENNKFRHKKHTAPLSTSPIATEGEIDWDVFHLLPQDIQSEIKEELRRRSLRTSPKKRKALYSDKDIALALSPSKKRTLNVLNNEFKIPKETSNIVFQGLPIDNIEAIKHKIYDWLTATLESGSVDDEDLDMFVGFMGQLLISRAYFVFLNLFEWLKVVTENKKDRKGYDKWIMIINTLDSLFNEQNYIEFEYNF